MDLVEHHNVVEALAAQGPDETFDIGICHGDRGAILTSWIPRNRTRLENTVAYAASPSRSSYRGAVFTGNASTSCRAVHWAVGVSVTLT